MLRGKVVVCGNGGVGKSALVQAFESDGRNFPTSYMMTTGVEFCSKMVCLHRQPEAPRPAAPDAPAQVSLEDSKDAVELLVYDCAGEALFLPVVQKLWSGAAMILLVPRHPPARTRARALSPTAPQVYDISDPDSLGNLEFWLNGAREANQGRPLIGAVVAAKIDLPEKQVVVPPEHGRAFAEAHRLDYFEVSAKENTGVDAPFIALATALRLRYQEHLLAFESAVAG